MIINIEEVWRDAKNSHIRFHTHLLQSVISNLMTFGVHTIEHRVGKFLETFYEQIIFSFGDALIPIISGFDFEFQIDAEREYVFNLLKEKISYKEFSEKKDFLLRPWCAYKLCARAAHVICPYCQYTTVDTQFPDPQNDHQYRPALDHFYAQSRYPYLSLTLGNLIPVCDKCNGSQFKHNRDFARNPHLNPLQDRESLKFQLSKAPGFSDMLIGSFNMSARSDHYVIELVGTGENLDKCNGSLYTFDLQRRYQPALDEIFRLRRQLRSILSRTQNIKEVLPHLNIELADTVGFALDDVSYKKIVLGKLKRDILEATNEEFAHDIFQLD